MAYPFDILISESPGTVPALVHGRGFGFLGINPVHANILRQRCVTQSRAVKTIGYFSPTASLAAAVNSSLGISPDARLVTLPLASINTRYG